MKPTVISLCDLTGTMVRPWVEDGHPAVLVDPQHGATRTEGPVTKIADTVAGAIPLLSELIRTRPIAAVFAFPPYTDLAVSGARWFEAKRAADPLFQAKAVAVAEQCRTVGRLSGAPWFVENPVSVLARVFGPADFWFHPWHFTGWERADNYVKRTNLWAGGGFTMPPQRVDPSMGLPDDRIHKAPPSAERGNIRSATPLGFARAVHAANATALGRAA